MHLKIVYGAGGLRSDGAPDGFRPHACCSAVFLKRRSAAKRLPSKGTLAAPARAGLRRGWVIRGEHPHLYVTPQQNTRASCWISVLGQTAR